MWQSAYKAMLDVQQPSKWLAEDARNLTLGNREAHGHRKQKEPFSGFTSESREANIYPASASPSRFFSTLPLSLFARSLSLPLPPDADEATARWHSARAARHGRPPAWQLQRTLPPRCGRPRRPSTVDADEATTAGPSSPRQAIFLLAT
jgi:hypothetical protein